MVSVLEREDALLFPQRLVDGFPIGFKGSSTEQYFIAEDEAKQDAASPNIWFVPVPVSLLY